ncbi:unnamed protein product [Absidia cylindrospora]
MALYQENASVVYITSGTTITTSAAIRKFYLSQKSSTTIVDQVHHKVSTANKIIEEAEWIVTFQHGECTWMLPNLDEHHFINATVKIPVVVSATFEDNLISSIRIYWDQASVLKQLGVISERNKWPVIGAEQVVALRNPPSNSNTTGPTSVEVPVKSSPGTNAFVPGRVFGPVHPDDQVRHAVRKPAENAAGRNIFSYVPPEAKPLVAHNPNKLGSSFSLAHDEGLRPSTTTASASSDDDSGLASPSTPPVSSPTSRRVAPEPRNIFAQYDENLSKKTASQLKVHDEGHIPSVRPQHQSSTGTRNIFTGQ